MPSPFPGVDPFIEGRKWRDFHHTYITGLREAQVSPNYVVEVEERVYLERVDGPPDRLIEPEVSVLKTTDNAKSQFDSGGASTVVAIPETLTTPEVIRTSEGYLRIFKRDGSEVVAVVEVLSPWNKSPLKGRAEYLSKRDAMLDTLTHLVELDFLRGGERLPTVEPLPSGDFYVFISSRERRPEVDVVAWSLEEPLPSISIPLDDDDVVNVSLQTVFDHVYDRSGYRRLLNYGIEVEPDVNNARLEWIRRVIEDVDDLRPSP